MTVYFQISGQGVIISLPTWEECLAHAEQIAQGTNSLIEGWEIIEDNR